MKILVACEESQAVTKELRRLGHEAYSCDIQECSGGHPEWHMQEDVTHIIDGRGTPNLAMFVLSQSGDIIEIPEKWDMIIAFPPCTYLSNAGACRLYPKKGQLNVERYKKGLEAKDFFLKFLNADCPRIAVENPVSSSVFQMPKHTQEIQPYKFNDDGTHPYTKKQGFGLKDCLRWFRQRRNANLWGRMSHLEPGERTVKNTGPQNVAKMPKTEQRLSPESPVQWQNSGLVKHDFTKTKENPCFPILQL